MKKLDALFAAVALAAVPAAAKLPAGAKAPMFATQAALAGKTLSGEVYGFDIAGNIIDAYTLALVVGFPNITSGPLPGVNDMLVQLVDAHGQPLDPAGTTMDSLKFDPPLQPLSVGAEGGLKVVSFPDPATRTLTVSFKYEDNQLESGLPAGTLPYQVRHTRVGLWPGFGHALKTVKPGGPAVDRKSVV